VYNVFISFITSQFYHHREALSKFLFQILDTTHTHELPTHHDGQPVAQCFTLLHAATWNNFTQTLKSSLLMVGKMLLEKQILTSEGRGKKLVWNSYIRQTNTALLVWRKTRFLVVFSVTTVLGFRFQAHSQPYTRWKS